MTPLRLVTIGCGSRGRTYSELAARDPARYRLVAGADPRPERVEHLAALSGDAAYRRFASADDLLAAGRLGDVAIVATQDADHVEPTLRALELGYHVLLEKPIAKDATEIERVLRASERTGRRVLVCHVLRYTALYTLAKRLIDAGTIGEVVAIEHSEGVGPWHQVHSFVRGHWADTAASSPMILAKCCHDADLLSWFAGRACTRVSSFGSLGFFRPERAPAGATARCTDGCPHAGTCFYDAMRYAGDQRPWLHNVDPALAATGGPEEIRAWLRTSPWGRCAWRCGNDAVDRQVVAMEFAGGAVATLTMTAFDYGRDTTIRGTTGVIRLGDQVKALGGHDLVVERFGAAREVHDAVIADGGYAGHGGGDGGLVAALADELAKPDARSMTTGIHASLESHRIALAAEASRRAGGKPIELAAAGSAAT